ncbi:MAG TPA: guanitoxin biosynthesis MATE family efflux transporter GntT [Nostocaceae cyanobacterium]|nr:guanitoxin biosynthesis MATE family efflux transporter GntT [Nostocaceae cyanobacterium]
MNLTLPQQYDFVPRFYRLAFVNVVSNLMIPLSGLISVAFLGHLTEIDALAGVSIANILFCLVYLTLEFLRMATTGLTAQAVGADDQEGVLLVGLRNALIALGLGIGLLILQYPLREVGFSLMSGDLNIKELGIEYYNARIWGAPAVLLNFVLIGWLLGREENNKVLLLSFLGSAANVILDYVFIIQWHWDGMGAGASQALSQYIMLFTGIIFSTQTFHWQELRAVIPKLLDFSAFKQTLALNRDIFIRTLTELSVYTIFGNLSASMGTILFTQNSLLGQINYASVFLINGLGFATETLSGNFKGQEKKDKFIPLLRISVTSSLFIGFIVSATCALFPQTIFGLLTNHTEITDNINNYTWWLFFVLAFNSASAILEAYFLGLAEGKIVRNVSLIITAFEFIPSVIAVWYFHTNHVLWFALASFQLAKMIAMMAYLPKSLSTDIEVNSESMPAV